MYSAFINPDHITPAISTLPALLTKSSMLWSTVFFIFTNKELRKKFCQNLVNQEDLKNYLGVQHEMQTVKKTDGEKVIIIRKTNSFSSLHTTKLRKLSETPIGSKSEKIPKKPTIV